MLADPSDAEPEVLGAIRYQPNDVVLHTDRSLLPRRRRAWASWNYHLQDEPVGRTTVTYHMNRLQTLNADREFCVTLNRSEAVDPEQVIRSIRYDHPVYTPAGLPAQGRWAEVSGARRTHYCGAYWGYGFHEDGVVSALRVCERFGRLLAMSASALYEGWVRHRRNEPVRTSSATGSSSATSTWTSSRRCSTGSRSGRRGGPPRPGSGAPTSWAPSVPAQRPAPWRPAGAPTARCGCSPACAPSGTCSTRSASTTASTAGASGWRRWPPRSPTRPGASATCTPSRASPATSPSASTCRPSWAWTPTTGAATVPGERLQVHVESTARRAPEFDATLSLERRELAPGALLRYPLQSLRVVAGIYAEAVRLKLKGAPYHPHPAR